MMKAMKLEAYFWTHRNPLIRFGKKGFLQKPKENRISGNSLNTLKDFLYQRKQRDVLNGQYSLSAAIDAVVPQGSILGPLLFLIYVRGRSRDF